MRLEPSEADMKKYLNGSHWLKFCARYKASDRLQTCFACGQENVSLHHRTYERLGRERLSDVVPLCQSHHKELHHLVNRGEATLYDAHKALKKLADPRGSVSRKHPERDLRNWRLGHRSRQPDSGVKKRQVTPEEARAMVQRSGPLVSPVRRDPPAESSVRDAA